MLLRSGGRTTPVSVRQHNEPSGHQTAWHYHVHVFPRYPGDNLYALPSRPGFVPAEERHPYARKLRSYFEASEPPSTR